MNYWDSLDSKKKRLVLLWLYILKTQPIEEISGSFLEPKWIDLDHEINAHSIPDYIYMMKPKQILTELNEVGGYPQWISGKIQ